MNKHNISFYTVTALLILGLMLGFACKKSEDTVIDETAQTRQKMEKAVGYTVSTVANLGDILFRNIVNLVTGSASEASQSFSTSYSYDDSTGWWIFDAATAAGQSASLQVMFLDSEGVFHKYYGSSTDSIQAKGTCSGDEGSCSFAVVITGVGLTDTTYVLNGNGSATYDGVSTTVIVDDMTMKRLDDGIPESGSVTMTANGVAFTVTFNGSETVTVTYSYQGLSYSFTVNLLTGAVSE